MQKSAPEGQESFFLGDKVLFAYPRNTAGLAIGLLVEPLQWREEIENHSSNK